MRIFSKCAAIQHNGHLTLHHKITQAMITSKLKSASDSWKLSYEDAINMMKAELEEARDD